VVGFDDAQEASHADPPLTTIGVDVIETGRNVADDYFGAALLAVRESCARMASERAERRA